MTHAGLPKDVVTAVGPAAVDAVAWRFKGQLNVTVIVKATFAFANDADMPRAAPEPVLREEVHHGRTPGRSIRLASEVAPYLGFADVTLSGDACSTRGPVRAMTVRLGVYRGAQALLDKALRVVSPEPFERMPVVYERAFGGGTQLLENPFGVGAAAATKAPNILHPADPRRVGCFGAVSVIWPLRKRRLGSTPRKAITAPIAEIPDDFDWSYFQSAPADQQIELLQGDEWILLEGLHPAHHRARMRLPSAWGLARIHGLSAFGVAEGQGLVLSADMLHIDAAELRCTVVWRRSFPLPNEAALGALRVLAGAQSAGEPIAWPEPSPVAARGPGRAAPGNLDSTMIFEAPALPEEEDDEILITTGMFVDHDEPEPQTVQQLGSQTAELRDDETAIKAPALPFRSGPAALPAPSQTPAPRARAAGGYLGSTTINISPDTEDRVTGRPVLPFFSDVPPVNAPVARGDAPGPAPDLEPPPGFRDVGSGHPTSRVAVVPEPPRAKKTDWSWREEPAPREPPAPAPAAPTAVLPERVDVRSLLYGAHKKRR